MDSDLWEMFEDGAGDDEVAAIIRLGHFAALPKNVRVVTQFSEIITVRMKRGSIPVVSGAPEVASITAGQTYLGPDIELEATDLAESTSLTMLPGDERRPGTEAATGHGVVVGVVDWGFDFAHPDFRNKDGSTRILALWDQRGSKRPDSPQPFGYGVVHDRAAINRALQQKDPYAALVYHPADADTGIGCHGTHVLGIAAASGSDDRPMGIAPEADLIVVHNSPWDEVESAKLGDSVTLLEGIDFIARMAGDRPWVVNLSMGRHGEQHDGSTLIEQGLDAAVRLAPGRAACLSAGNYFDKRIHASGQLRPTQERTLAWEITEGKPTDNQLEFWYSWQDKFEVSVRSPDGAIVARAKLGERAKFLVGGKEVGNIYHRGQEPNNLDNHISIYLYKEAPTGAWEVTISGVDVIDGRYHAWIERDVACPKCQSRFHPDDADPRSTTGTICNGRRTLAVGAYDAHDAEMRLGHFSSGGPTRDGRLKPDLCAPGVRVLAARSAPRNKTEDTPLLTRMSGTSMAAPHVTGTVALMFQAASRRLRIEETHNLLLQSARRVTVPDTIPDRVGIGFLDVEEAVNAARKLTGGTAGFKQITVQVPAANTPKVSVPRHESSEQELAEQETTLAVEGRSEAEYETEFEAAEVDDYANTFHRIANDITGAFEGGRPGTLNLYDLGVISYGKHQATLASGTLLGILKRFAELSSSNTASGLAGYLDRVQRRDETLREDATFIRLLKDAAKEPEMNRAQDEEFSRQYWEPAKKKARASNIKTALGYALFYDTRIQGGLDQVQKKVEARLGGKTGDTVRAVVIAEHDALRAFVDERIQRNLRISANQKKQSEEMDKSAQALEEQAAEDPGRAEELKRQAAQKRRKAKQYAANAAALEISSTKTRGPSFQGLIDSGDLNLYDGDAGKIHLKGKPGVAIASLKPGAMIDATTPAESEFVQKEGETAPAECACQHAIEATIEMETAEFAKAETAEWESEAAELILSGHDAEIEWEGGEGMESETVLFESLAEDIVPTAGACSPTSVNCLFPPDSDTKLIRPKGKPDGDFIERTQGDPKVNFALQLTDYDVDAYTPSKTRHAEALGKIREFIVNRFVQTSEPIAVTVTGSASRTGGKAYNDALSCKRAICAADNLRRSLETFRGVAERVQINSAGEGFTRATCKGSDCELGEWRSVLVQVHAPNDPPRPVPVVDPGWDKYTIRCCAFHTEGILSALLGDLLKKGLPELPDKLKGKLLKLIEKGLKKLIEVLQKALPKLQGVAEEISEFLKLFPAEIIRERGTFEIREREKPNARGVVLCYSGLGLRVLFPREKIDEFIDDALGKVPGLRALPDFVKKQIRDGIKKALPGVLKTLIHPIDSDKPGPLARFDLKHPRLLKVFEGSVQVGKGVWMPGQVNVEFDSPPWNRPDPIERPIITSCPDTACNASGVQTIVGDGQGLELFSITAGDLVGGSCTCETPAGSSREGVPREFAMIEAAPAELVEMADEIVDQTGQASPVAVLHELLERLGRPDALAARDSGSRLSAANIFDSFAYPGRTDLRIQLEQNFHVVALPGTTLNRELREGDLMLRRGDGQFAHVALIASPQLRGLDELLSAGLKPENFTAGNFAHVVEAGAVPHTLDQNFARLVTGPEGLVPADSLVLRLGPTPAGVETEGAASDFSERGSRLLEDILAIRLATPPPQPVVVMQQPAGAVAKEPAAGQDIEAFPEDDVSCTHIDASQLSWSGASSDQLDFMRNVYQRQVRASCQLHAFVKDVPKSELGPIEDGQQARAAAADSCRRLLADARAAMKTDPAASEVRRIGVASGYRSASQQFHNWNRNFPRYYENTRADRTKLEGGEHGDAAAKLLARYISGILAAPGFSLHNNGLAIDFSAVERGVSMGPVATKQSRAQWRASWFFRWLSDNAASYLFYQNTSIDEPWHWEFRQLSEQFSNVEGARETEFLPEVVDPIRSETWQDSFSSEATIGAGRLALCKTPLLAKHRGTQPDLILRWNDMTDPQGVDIVIHLHGFSDDLASMKLCDKEKLSGLDFSNPENSSNTRAGRLSPTLCILPRGAYIGDQPNQSKKAYDFPSLVTRKGFLDLIDYSLKKFGAANGMGGSPVRNRLVLTAHSGGGKALVGILANGYVPDEIQVFDALYWNADPLIQWVRLRIANEIAAWLPGKQKADGGLCILYRTKKGTGTQSLRVNKAIQAAVAAAPPDAQPVLRSAYRVLKTAVDHDHIPPHFGWLLLADIAQSLADVNPPDEAEASEVESFFSESIPIRADRAYILWIQQSLNDLEQANLTVDGLNGPLTKAAVRRFQSHHPPLVVDGIVGPYTEAALQAAGAPPPPGGGLVPNVVDSRIDVSAQQSIQRMMQGPPDAQADGNGMVAAVKASSLAGIYGDNLEVAARLAQRYSKARWELIPTDEDAALVLDADAPYSVPPTIVFRGDEGRTVPGGVRGNPNRLDPALRKAYSSFFLWRSGALSACPLPGVVGAGSGILEQAPPPPTVNNVVPATCSVQPAPLPAATRIASKWTGIDRMNIPKHVVAGHLVGDTDWMGTLIDNSNIRFTGAYVTGVALAGQAAADFTGASKDTNRQWVPNIQALNDQGWGIAYFYVGYSVGGGAKAPTVGVDRARGTLHGSHLRTILSRLGANVAGSVVFIDNEDSTSTTLPNNLLEYYDGLFDEMSRPDPALAAFRPGLYGHGKPLNQMLSRRRDLFLWDVFLDTATTTTPTAPFDLTADPIAIDPVSRPLKAYKGAPTGQPAFQSWSVGRQFRFYTGSMPVAGSAIATRLAWSAQTTWDYNSSFARDPAYPVAEPRIYAKRRGADWLAVASFFAPRTARPTPPSSVLRTQGSVQSRAVPVAPNVFVEPDAPVHLFELGTDFVLVSILATGTIGISRLNSAGQWSSLDQITGTVPALRRLRTLGGVSRTPTEAHLFLVGADNTLHVKRLTGTPPWSDALRVNATARLHPFSNLAVTSRGGFTVDAFFVDEQGILTTSYWASSFTTPWPSFQLQVLETAPSLLRGGTLAAVSPHPDHLLVFGVSLGMQLAFAAFLDHHGWSAVTPAGQAQDLIGAHTRLAATVVSATEVEVAALTDGGQLVVYTFRWNGTNWTAGARRILADPPALSGAIPTPPVGAVLQPANGFRINPFCDLSILRLPDQACSKVFCAGLRNGESKTLVCDLGGGQNAWQGFV